jgi:hypothetical protein
MTRADFEKFLSATTETLFSRARAADELSFLFSILGLNSGMEDAGWQPINETQQLVADLSGLINGPIYEDAKIRLALLLYCHITESSYHYHVLYNLLLTVERTPPKLFSFLDKYTKSGRPPTVSAKLSEIRSVANRLGLQDIGLIFDEIIRADIRNAFFHSDYILHEDVLRLKHRGSEIRQISTEEVYELVGKTVDFFRHILRKQSEARMSFRKGRQITNRKSPDGRELCSVEVLVDDKWGATGFKSLTPGDFW